MNITSFLTWLNHCCWNQSGAKGSWNKLKPKEILDFRKISVDEKPRLWIHKSWIRKDALAASLARNDISYVALYLVAIVDENLFSRLQNPFSSQGVYVSKSGAHRWISLSEMLANFSILGMVKNLLGISLLGWYKKYLGWSQGTIFALGVKEWQALCPEDCAGWNYIYTKICIGCLAMFDYHDHGK